MSYKPFIRSLIVSPIILALSLVEDSQTASSLNNTTPNLKVASIGDQGVTAESRAVLELILSEGADMVLHQGNIDDPVAWKAEINDLLGPSFPYFASMGNHDLKGLYPEDAVLAQWA